MTPLLVTAISASELLRKVLSAHCEEDGLWETNSPRGMPIRERRNAWFRLNDTSRCAAWLPERNLNYPFMAAEFLWIFCGRDDVEMISHYNKKIAKFSDNGKTFFGAYGPRWRGQIGDVVENLRRDPDSRQAVVSIFRPEALREIPILEGDGELRYGSTKDVPCTLSMQYLIRNGKLEAGVVMRSSDAWLGLPYDIFNFSMLQRAVAAELNVKPGALTMFVGSSHLYELNLKQAKDVIAAEFAYYNRYGTHPTCLLEIPGPPGLAFEKVDHAENSIRKGFTSADLDCADAGDAWLHFFSVLAYRNHRQLLTLENPWNLLAGDYK